MISDASASPDDVIVRDATATDLEAVLALWDASRSAIAVRGDRREDLEAMLAAHPSSLLVAESGGQVVGALIAAWDGWRGNMYRLAVAVAYRRRGIGTELIAAGHERLREKGARRITALVGRESDAAKALWRSAGYDEDEQIARFVKNI